MNHHSARIFTALLIIFAFLALVGLLHSCAPRADARSEARANARAAYAFRPLTPAQYAAIITAGSLSSPSPMLGGANYDAVMAAAKRIDVDPRVLLAGIHWESHYGSDPGGMAAVGVNNLAGIAWGGQEAASDSGMANGNGGTYAAFASLPAFIDAYADMLTSDPIGEAFQAGDLAGAWAIYIGGPARPDMAGGQARVDQWRYLLSRYP